MRSPTIAATSKQHFYATHMASNPMSKNGSIFIGLISFRRTVTFLMLLVVCLLAPRRPVAPPSQQSSNEARTFSHWRMRLGAQLRMIALERPMEEDSLCEILLVASSLVISLAGTAQAFAQSSNPKESAARATMQSRTPGGTWAVIEAQVKNTLEQAGFKNIEVMPSSFVVQADKNGQSLTLVINSDGKTVSYLPVSPTNNPDEERKDADKTLGKE